MNNMIDIIDICLIEEQAIKCVYNLQKSYNDPMEFCTICDRLYCSSSDYHCTVCNRNICINSELHCVYVGYNGVRCFNYREQKKKLFN